MGEEHQPMNNWYIPKKKAWNVLEKVWTNGHWKAEGSLHNAPKAIPTECKTLEKWLAAGSLKEQPVIPFMNKKHNKWLVGKAGIFFSKRQLETIASGISSYLNKLNYPPKQGNANKDLPYPM